jgi:PIN domain nuclease of toxin-antitoxin system
VSRGFVFDTSALLAPLLREPGGDVVLQAVASGLPVLLSAVNLAEAIGILHRRLGLPPHEARTDVLSLGLEVVAFDAEQAQEVGALEPLLRNSGIAFGDRACLMLGRVRSLPVLTADRPWAALGLGVEVRLIR